MVRGNPGLCSPTAHVDLGYPSADPLGRLGDAAFMYALGVSVLGGPNAGCAREALYIRHLLLVFISGSLILPSERVRFFLAAQSTYHTLHLVGGTGEDCGFCGWLRR